MTAYESLLNLVALSAEPNEFAALERMRDALLQARRILSSNCCCGIFCCRVCQAIKAIDKAMETSHVEES